VTAVSHLVSGDRMAPNKWVLEQSGWRRGDSLAQEWGLVPGWEPALSLPLPHVLLTRAGQARARRVSEVVAVGPWHVPPGSQPQWPDVLSGTQAQGR
jgi:hypothetical protein